MAISLRTASTGSVTGLEEPALRGLTKLQQILPSRPRHRVTAFQTALLLASAATSGVDAEALTAIAASCRDQRRIRIRYLGPPGRRRAKWSRTGWCTPRAAGTCWPGTWANTTGGPSASTGSNWRPDRPALASRRDRSHAKTPPPCSPAPLPGPLSPYGLKARPGLATKPS